MNWIIIFFAGVILISLIKENINENEKTAFNFHHSF